MFSKMQKIGLFVAATLCSGALFALPANVVVQPKKIDSKLKLNICANLSKPLKTLTAVNNVDCDASVDPTFDVYFGIVNVYKNGQTITPRASCQALSRGDKVKLVLKQGGDGKKFYDVHVCK